MAPDERGKGRLRAMLGELPEQGGAVGGGVHFNQGNPPPARTAQEICGGTSTKPGRWGRTLDTIAFRDDRQTHHAEARETVATLSRERARFVGTAFVFAETHTTFARSRAPRERISADFWENPLLNQAEVTHVDHRKAIALLRQHGDKSYPFCDAISFVVMQRLGVKRVAALADHFRQFGGLEMVG